jgi:hypothetical protein
LNDIERLKEEMLMVVIRVPFCATAELWPPFMLDEDFSDPNGVKSVLFDTSQLQVAAKQEMIEVPNIGPIEMCAYYVVGSIPYICAAYPVVRSGDPFNVQQRMATFSSAMGNTAASDVRTSASDALLWISAAGVAHVDASIGGACTLNSMPHIKSVTVEDLAVANNLTSSLAPAGTDASGAEEAKRIVKWRGRFVITTTA